MESDWVDSYIGNIADVAGGSTPSTSDPTNFDGDVPWLTPKDLAGQHERYVARGERNLSLKGLASCSAQLLPRGTVLLSSRAPIGYAAIAAEPISTNQGFRSLVPKPGVESEFLYYWLTANVDELERYANGSTFKELSGSSLKQIPIRLPARSIQRTIAYVLGSLDERIELAQRTNHTLEGLVRALFTSWFVSFDPVRAKAAGRQPERMDAATAALFPSEFERREIGETPKGWHASILGEGFDIVMGQSPPGDTYNQGGVGLPFYQGRADFGFRYPKRRVFCTAPTRLAAPGDTLVSVRAPVGAMNMALEPCSIGRGVASILHKSGNRSFTYYSLLQLQPAFAAFEGGGTVFGSINKADIAKLPALLPPDSLIESFEQMSSPLDRMIENNERQSKALVEARDALLPKLLTGEIRVSDIDSFLDGRL